MKNECPKLNIGQFNHMVNDKKNIIIFSFLLLLIALINLNFNKKEEEEKEVVISLKEYLIENFISELPEINKRLPYKIDDKTVLISVEFNDNKIINTYDIAILQTNYGLTNKIEQAVREKSCADELKKKLLLVGIPIVERYRNLLGELILEVKLSNSICYD